MILVVLCFTGSAIAQPTVTVSATAGTPDQLPKITQQTDGKWLIDIWVTSTFSSVVVTIQGDPTEEVEIQRIRIEGDLDGQVNLEVLSSLTAPIILMQSVFLDDLDGPSSLDPDCELVLSTINIDKGTGGTLGNLGVTGGSITVERISVIDVEGDIISSLTATGPNTVNRIEAGGSILGDIDLGGSCNGILVGIGSGTGTSNIGVGPMTVDWIDIDIAGDLANITGDNIYARIDVQGNLRILSVNGTWPGTGTPLGDGVFAGTLDCDTISGIGPEVSFSVYGDMNADITIEDELASDKRIGIGDDLGGGGSITFTQSDGLKGDITVGWIPGLAGQWLGNIIVGSTTLNPKGDYTQTGLGGGFVGEVSYGLHKQASSPAYAGSTWPTITYTGDCTATDPPVQQQIIDLVHYGEVADTIVTGEPFEVTYAVGNHCTGPQCFHGADYVADDSEWELHSNTPFPDGRTMRIVGQMRPNTHYHIIVDETLECTDAFDDGTTVKTKPYVYVIYMSACP
jgi:hypothetical protein